MIQTTLTKARKFQAILRNDLPVFIHKAFTTLCPGQEFERSGTSKRSPTSLSGFAAAKLSG
jgi:hypothetical protein